jgi:hypothetical protein
MRKLCMLFVLLALFIPGLVLGAGTVNMGSQITVAWDPVTVPTGSTVQYQMFYRTDPGGSQTSAGNPLTSTQATVTFVSEGTYDIGVQAQRLQNGVVVSSSSVSWSNDPTRVQGGNTFMDQYMAPPPGPANLRIPPPPAGGASK